MPPGTVPVEGVLVASSSPAAAAGAVGATSAPLPAARPGSAADPADLTLPIGLALTALLVGLGAVRERRRRLR